MGINRLLSPDFSRPGRQPQQAVRLNRAHPLARGLVGCWIGSQARGQYMRDLANGADFQTTVGSVAPTAGVGGVGPKTATGLVYTGAAPRCSLSNYTVMMVAEITSIPAAYGTIYDKMSDTGSGQGFAFARAASGDVFSIYHGVAAEKALTNLKPSSVLNLGVKTIIISYDGTNVRAYLDGVLMDTVAYTAPAVGSGNVVLFASKDKSTTYSSNGTCYAMDIWDHALSDAEAFSVTKDPYQMLEAVRPTVIGVTVAGGGITASITITEAAETFTAPSNVGITSSITEADPADVFASSSTVAISGTVTVADPADVLTASSAVGISGSITLAEIADTFAASSNIAISGSLALTDTDVLASVVNVAISGTLAITEGADIFAANVNVGNGLTASITVTEAADAFAANAGVGVSGAMSMADQADTLAAQIALAISGAVAISDPADVLAASGAVAISASLARTDTDLPAAVVNVAISGITSITDPADVFAAVLTAFAIAAASERILSVQAENRSMSVAAELRTISLSTESRTLTIRAE